MRRLGSSMFGWLALVATGAAMGQGFVVDRHVRPNPTPMPTTQGYEIREVSVDARVVDQVAEVRVGQVFHNPGSTTIEAEYLFPLPEGAGVQNLVLLVDGQELPGKVMGKDEARRIYEEIVRTKRDPALLEYVGRGLFRASVFPIPPGADRKVTLRYTQLCRRDRDVIEFLYPLATQKHTSKPIAKMSLAVDIRGRDAIKSIYCPSDDVTVSRSGEHDARVTMERHNVIPSGDFRLVVTLAEGAFGATVLSVKPSEGEDGYFLLLASPQVKVEDTKPLPKTVVFVLDRSGSMAGKKLDQAKNALRFVLNNLRDDDTFNIIVYDDLVEPFKPELQRFSSKTREEAERFVANIREGGSTNIDDALKAAMGQVPDDSRPNYVIFLTDGLPTAGQTGELKIAANCRQANKAHARVFAFGVGFDVNARLLDRLGTDNGGTSEYVRPDEDIEAHVAAFYGKMTRPALASLSIELAGTDVNRTYPRDLPDLFEGGQLAWVGRYTRAGKVTVRLAGKVGGERRSFEFPADLASVGSGSGRDYVETLWAVRRVGSIIDQIDLDGPNKELTDELVSLSTKYGLLTPYTSFLADDRVSLHASAANNALATENLAALREVAGASGTAQRDLKQMYKTADRFETAYDAGKPGGMTSNKLMNMGNGMGGMGAAVGGSGLAGQGQSLGRSAGPLPATAQFAMPAHAQPSQAGRPAIDPTANVRRVGSKTFFRKDNRWVDSEVRAEDEAKAVAIEQFSEPFFHLARDNNPERNRYLTFDGAVTVLLDGQVYRIDPPASR